MIIRVLLADDQALFREALRTLISLQPDLEVVGEATLPVLLAIALLILKLVD